MPIQQLISRRRVVRSVAADSKTRLLEELSALLTDGAADVDAGNALKSLLERESLGSTGIGDGVALPHGRLAGLTQAVGAFVTLEHELDYDALDRKPVRMAFALLVPPGANQEHLQLLRELAIIFSDRRKREQLLRAASAEEIYRVLTDPPPA